jgi:hypothetical protein
MTALDELLRRAARAQDESERTDGVIDEAHRRLVASGAMTAAPRRATARARAGLGLGVAIAAAAVVGLVSRRARWTSGPRANDSELRFSDGSTIQQQGALARIESVDRHGATVRLERGTIHASIQHRSGTRWTLLAGPFSIHVVGTRFSLSWDPIARQMNLSLTEGAVRVDGPLVGSQRVSTSQGIRVDLATQTVQWSGAADAGALVAASEPLRTEPIVEPAVEPPVEPAVEPPVERPSIAGAAERPRTDPAPRVALRPSESVARDPVARDPLQAQADGGARAPVETADAMLARAEQARIDGDSARARELYQAVDRQFPSSREAATAVFLLARLRADVDRDWRHAAEDFSRYLSIAPEGPFAEAAAGRRIEALLRAGDSATAVQRSREYLLRYPAGAHRSLAERLVDGSTL